MGNLEQNQAAFGKAAKHYVTNFTKLDKPEVEVFRLLADRLPQMSVLDLGVGTGRTTEFLISRVKDYVGVDYSAPMINECLKRFNLDTRARFEVMDARDLRAFSDASFDFVLFSFNGIDCITHEGRLKVLAEVRRVLRPGGFFCFSSHNLNYDLFKRNGFSLHLNPRILLRRARRWLQFRLLNRDYQSMRQKGSALIRDGSESFKLTNYYIRSEAQLKELMAAGYEEVQIFGLATGMHLSRAEAAESEDAWLYYLAKRA